MIIFWIYRIKSHILQIFLGILNISLYHICVLCIYSQVNKFPSHVFNRVWFFLKILFIYSWETHRERQRHRQREKQAPCREPDAGLDPRTLGSCPEPKADVQLLSHPGVPPFVFLWSFESVWGTCHQNNLDLVQGTPTCMKVGKQKHWPCPAWSPMVDIPRETWDGESRPPDKLTPPSAREQGNISRTQSRRRVPLKTQFQTMQWGWEMQGARAGQSPPKDSMKRCVFPDVLGQQ